MIVILELLNNNKNVYYNYSLIKKNIHQCIIIDKKTTIILLWKKNPQLIFF